MDRNLTALGIGSGLLLGIFLLAFQGDARPRADFVWGNDSEPQTLDPLRMSGVISGSLSRALFEGLTIYHPKTLEALPGVAESWELDGLTYTFHLRDDAPWVHQGEPLVLDGATRWVRADDFDAAFRLRAYPETGSEYAYLFDVIVGFREYHAAVAEQWSEIGAEQVARGGALPRRPADLDPDLRARVDAFRLTKWKDEVGVEVVDAQTLRITLRSPAPYFPMLTSFHTYLPVCPEVVAENPDRWTRPETIVTNGPYWLEEWRFNSHIRMRKNRHYWEDGEWEARFRERLGDTGRTPSSTERQQLALLDRGGNFVERGLDVIEALAVEAADMALNLYLNGDIDFCKMLPTSITGDLIEAARDPEAPLTHMRHAPWAASYYYSFNLTLPVFQGEIGYKLRRAMALSIDRETLIAVASRAHEQPAYRLVPPMVPEYPATPLLGTGNYDRDLAEAKRLMAEVRAERPNLPKLQILYNTRENHAKIAAFIQSIWQGQLGLEITLTNQEWGTYLDARRTTQFDIIRAAWTADYADPNTFLDMFTVGGPNNDPRYENALYEEIIKDWAENVFDWLGDADRREQFEASLARSQLWIETIRGRESLPGLTYEQRLREALEAHDEASDATRSARVFSVRLVLLDIAEAILLHDLPFAPIFFSTVNQLWPPELEGMHQNIIDVHPQKFLRWRDGRRPIESRYDEFPRFETRPSKPETAEDAQ